MKLISKLEKNENILIDINIILFCFSFNANVYFDSRDRKINLYPITKRKEDYIQGELRRLRQSLRSESMKMRRPPQLNFV